jgi:hypothetical protein
MARPTLVLAVAATLLTSCVGSTELQVLERANREAKAAGYDLRHYRASAHYNFREANDTWVVFYEGISDARGYGTVGDHFTVYVPNRGGEVELMPGR